MQGFLEDRVKKPWKQTEDKTTLTTNNKIIVHKQA